MLIATITLTAIGFSLVWLRVRTIVARIDDMCDSLRDSEVFYERRLAAMGDEIEAKSIALAEMISRSKPEHRKPLA